MSSCMTPMRSSSRSRRFRVRSMGSGTHFEPSMERGRLPCGRRAFCAYSRSNESRGSKLRFDLRRLGGELGGEPGGARRFALASRRSHFFRRSRTAWRNMRWRGATARDFTRSPASSSSAADVVSDVPAWAQAGRSARGTLRTKASPRWRSCTPRGSAASHPAAEPALSYADRARIPRRAAGRSVGREAHTARARTVIETTTLAPA